MALKLRNDTKTSTEDIMKKLRIAFLSLAFSAILLLSGCDDIYEYYDDTPPVAPRNIYTVTGDNRIDIFWDRNRESDLAGYNVYYSFSYNGKYTLIGSTRANSYIDDGAKNGETYYYAITAYDYDGNESELSNDVIYDTPRPEGFNQSIFDYSRFPNNSGYDFSKYLILPYNDQYADLFFENYNGKFFLNVWDDSDIQDMGKTNDIWDIDVAPTGGWVPLNSNENIKYTEAIIGHTYVIWTWDNHYAKVRIKNITGERVVFDWAYQLVEGNRELKRKSVEKRESLPNKILRIH